LPARWAPHIALETIVELTSTYSRPQIASITPVVSMDDSDKMFIYMHESGNNPARRNSYGCVGLGQDCNGIIYKICPSLEYTCEDNYFTSYMLKRYKTWASAKAFWLARTPINGKDVGNWW